MNILKQACLAAAVLAFGASGAAAVELAAPEGRVVLTVTGDIENTNSEAGAVFDLEMLEALPGRETVVETPWYEDVQRFSGPTLRALLEAVGATGDTLEVIALNDYSSEIPVTEIEQYPVILATRKGGEVMSVREKGPAFVIYPFDIAPELYNEKTFGRSVWQVTRIEVR
jgi:hypothetical protein